VDVSVDSSRCQGHARCNLLCPEVFDLDEAGFVVLISPLVPVQHERAVEEAVLNCPEQAIAIS
jgi:ferredoxin